MGFCILSLSDTNIDDIISLGPHVVIIFEMNLTPEINTDVPFVYSYFQTGRKDCNIPSGKIMR